MSTPTLKGLSTVVQSLPRSGIREIIDLASALPGVVRLEVGEPDSVTAAHIIDAAHTDAAAGYTKYTPTVGLMSLREAIAAHLSRRWRYKVGPENVFVAAGGLGAATAAILSIAEADDELLVPDPRWPNLMGLLAIARIRPVEYQLLAENNYLPDCAQLRSSLSPRLKAIYINSPSNPTGAVFPHEHVHAMAQLAAEQRAYLISDEVYDECVYEGQHTPAALFDQGHVITIGSFSKTYAMTGWRVGYAIAPPDVVASCAKVAESYSLVASSVSQRGAEAALKGSQESMEKMRRAFLGRRDLVVRLLQGSGLLVAVPQGAFYALLDMRRLGVPSRDLAIRLLQEESVATSPGSTFGNTCEGMLRISLASHEADLTRGCEGILRFVTRHEPRAAGPSRASR